MPYKDSDKKKIYEKTNFMPRITLSFVNNKDNADFVERLKEAAENKGLSLQKYIILATKEKLDRDGYI